MPKPDLWYDVALVPKPDLVSHVHPLDIGLWCDVARVAFESARRLKLPLRGIVPDSDGGGQQYYGCCHIEAGVISITLRFRHHTTSGWLGRRPVSEIWDTLAHELAHLDDNGGDAHGPRFHALMAEALQVVTAVRFNLEG